MLKTAVEAAALIGVVAAIIAGLFYAMGTVANLSYLNALGFDAHQFPTVGLELQAIGLLFMVLPALVAGLVALAYACLFALTDRFTGWFSRHPPPAKWRKWRMPIGLLVAGVAGGVLIVVVLIVLSLVRLPQWTLTQWIVAGMGGILVILAPNLFGKWVIPVVVYCSVGALMLASAIQHVNDTAYELGKARAAEAGNNHATTIIEFTDGHKILAPGAPVICSERFCGFHDGTTATVISLEGVRSIQSPAPQERTPTAQ